MREQSLIFLLLHIVDKQEVKSCYTSYKRPQSEPG